MLSIDALKGGDNKKGDQNSEKIFRVELTLRVDWNSKEGLLPSKSEFLVPPKPEVWNRPFSYDEYAQKIKSTFDFVSITLF